MNLPDAETLSNCKDARLPGVRNEYFVGCVLDNGCNHDSLHSSLRYGPQHSRRWCNRRVQQLEASGYVTVLDQSLLGLPVNAFAEVRLVREGKKAAYGFCGGKEPATSNSRPSASMMAAPPTLCVPSRAR